jgi:hypothetical protein
MLHLTPPLAEACRPATDYEVYSRSYGVLKAPRRPEAGSWQARRGTLDDQAAFGPLRDCECACGLFRGPDHRGKICHICGVKVATPAVRRERFGHIDLPTPLLHPFGCQGESLSALPVLPAAFIASPAGAPMAELYEEVLRACATGNSDVVFGVVERLFSFLLPAARLAVGWALAERDVFVHGLALEWRENATEFYGTK